jgi:hypothetical protein
MTRIARRSLSVAAITLLAGSLLFAQADPKVGKAQEFIQYLSKGQWAKAFERLDSNLGFQLKSADKLAGIWGGLEAKTGPFKEFREGRADTVKDGPETFVVVTQVCKFEKGLMDLKVKLDAMDRVANLNWVSHKAEPKPAAAGAAPAPPEGSPAPPHTDTP